MCSCINKTISGNGRGRAFDTINDRERTRGWGGGSVSGSGTDKIDALGSLLSGNGRGRAFDTINDRERTRGWGGGSVSGSGTDKIDALGSLLSGNGRGRAFDTINDRERTRGWGGGSDMASELKLNMRSDGYLNVNDLLKLNLKTLDNILLRSNTIDGIREAVREDNKQRFSLIEENMES
ncbi:unnamed protein product [Vicia faba]|uniref:2'-phosphotransferase n=1 Tax=Vicia faba TaxID=3906 RepID=A0AAV0Z793_VICFA|nr:unnamed protein product [Vicia faba]